MAHSFENQMNHSTSLIATQEDHRVARMAAFAIGLTLVEAAIPTPLPGVKPGLANIVTLLVLLRFGLRDAIWVSLLRIVSASLILGTFLSPGFALSLSGGLASLLALALLQHLPRKWFGPVSLSIISSFAHMAAQLAVVRLWLIPHDGVFYLAPVFALASLIFGLANGLIASRLLLENPKIHQTKTKNISDFP